METLRDFVGNAVQMMTLSYKVHEVGASEA